VLVDGSGGSGVESVLITGGAGFIGAHLAGDLLSHGYAVRVLDNLTPQVHGDGRRPAYLPDNAELIVGDLRDPVAVRQSLQGVDSVVHLAARVGVGQSMYEIADYAGVNTWATAVLLEALMDRPVERLVVASSMSVYGEGLYQTSEGRRWTGAERTRDQLERGQWEPVGAEGQQLTPVPTPETKPASLSSIYALTKFDQEKMCLLFGASYRMRTVALRFFNVYGPHQALSNPYTGVLAIFAARLLNDRRPLIFEDGEQRRDFVSVTDVVRACRLALEGASGDHWGHAINIGSGRSISVNEIAAQLGALLGKEEMVPEVTGKYRVGDIRHCFADISRARELLSFEPEVRIEDGMRELAGWLEGQVAEDRAEAAAAELSARGLTI
jgi:dTDP-L-rhamnose 4-epimerase